MLGKLDNEVIEKFKIFQERTDKYRDLKIENMEFENSDMFNDKENIELIGSKKIGSHDELEEVNDEDGIPVYDASANILTYIKKDKFPNEVFTVNDNNNPDISFASEGNSSAGTNFIIHKDSYFINNHRIVMKFTKKYYSKYIYYNIFKMKEKYGFKRGYIPSQTELKRLKILVPIPKDLNETYTSYKIQEIIVEFLEFWRDYTNNARTKAHKKSPIYKKIKELIVKNTFKYDKFLIERFDEFIKSTDYTLKLSEITFKEEDIVSHINMARGKVISKKDLIFEGKYPVYSSQTKNNGLFGYLNDYMYEGKAITWTTDGKHAGTTFLREGKFNYTNVCGLITIKNTNVSDIEYLSYLTAITFPKYVDRTSQNSKLMTHHIENIKFFIPIHNCCTSKQIQQLLVEFWEELISAIDKKLEIYKQMVQVADIIDRAFLYRTFNKIDWSKEHE